MDTDNKNKKTGCKSVENNADSEINPSLSGVGFTSSLNNTSSIQVKIGPTGSIKSQILGPSLSFITIDEPLSSEGDVADKFISKNNVFSSDNTNGEEAKKVFQMYSGVSHTGDNFFKNNDLSNREKYDRYSREWTSSNAVSNNSSAFKFSLNGQKTSSNSEVNSNFTKSGIESLVWMDLNNKVNDFSNELNANKRTMADNKRKLNSLISKVAIQTNKITNFDTSLKNAEEKLSDKVSDFEKEIVTARNSLLAVIALFASFFTFISISVNIFSRDMSLSTSISVLLVIWCCLISFIFVFMAGISKGGRFFTSFTFIKHAFFMVVLFICAFVLPRVIFSVLPIQWFP
ncbi:Yip1 family protein [Citrobacter werkmanii]|uniref:Yip1 family protein n=1 Tax=Citrobacter werkmanii TaxID=67827 RepID=UPI00264DF55D|nr:Yip1 family protein [Citrobacter werkmanii]MDN8555728.1 Yip1 family protein [Citrobacter werkmanii]